MKDERKTQLEFPMNKHMEKLEQKEKQEELVEREKEANSSEFVKIIKNIIRPVMEEMGNILKEHGHNYSISYCDDSLDKRAREKEETKTKYQSTKGT
ncbi:hypothetical protein ACFLW3_00635 [Chloroflexota bacterium]